jgi:hypothetical protein
MEKAIALGATDFGISNRKNKRFYVIYNNKPIHFGSNTNNTFIDHHDEKIRKAWKARHSKILKDGKPAYKNKTSAEFWSYNILW